MFLLNKTKKLHIYLVEKWCMCKWMKEKKKEVKTPNWTKKKQKKAIDVDEALVHLHMSIFVH